MPEIPMDQLQEADLRQTYFLLYKHIMSDFVHKDDLKAILAANNVHTILTGSAGTSPITGTGNGAATFTNFTEAAAKAKKVVYDALAKTGGAVREEVISAVEAGIKGA